MSDDYKHPVALQEEVRLDPAMQKSISELLQEAVDQERLEDAIKNATPQRAKIIKLWYEHKERYKEKEALRIEYEAKSERLQKKSNELYEAINANSAEGTKKALEILKEEPLAALVGYWNAYNPAAVAGDPLTLACHYGNTEVMRSIVSVMVSSDIEVGGAAITAAFKFAIGRGDIELVKGLFRYLDNQVYRGKQELGDGEIFTGGLRIRYAEFQYKEAIGYAVEKGDIALLDKMLSVPTLERMVAYPINYAEVLYEQFASEPEQLAIQRFSKAPSEEMAMYLMEKGHAPYDPSLGAGYYEKYPREKMMQAALTIDSNLLTWAEDPALNVIDKGDDGKLDFKDVARHFREKGLKLSEVDKDGDGEVSKSEFITAAASKPAKEGPQR